MTGIQEKESHFRHVPVLVEEVLQYAPEGCRAVLGQPYNLPEHIGELLPPEPEHDENVIPFPECQSCFQSGIFKT